MMSRTRPLLLATLTILSFLPRAHALGPHEIALLVNKNSPRSLEVANEFVKLRHVPAANVILLALPDSVLAPEAEMSPEDFTRLIWDPARKVIRERRIEDHILAWIYSVDFPVRITSDPPVSLQGITFVRDKVPEAAAIADGSFLSPLFRGPDKVDGPEGEPITLERFTPLLRQSMPLPSMMLGFTGARGMTVEQVLRMLKYGAISDHSDPKGSVYFVVNSDIRSRCRDWQFPRVESELKTLGIDAVISSNTPLMSAEIMGMQVGSPWPAPAHSGTFLPGAMAEHLTSFGAVFQSSEQAPLTEWLRAGATASAGTVTEPMSIWTKFPAGRFFTHYATGCTMLESFFQAIRSPLQILLVGEPLAKPWEQPMEITLVSLSEDDKPVSGDADFLATLWPGLGQPNPELLFLLDGRAVMHPADEPKLKLDTRPLTDGYHELRVIAYARQQVRHQSFAMAGFDVGNHERACTLQGVSSNGEVDIDHPLQVSVRPNGLPKEVAVVCQERVLARMPYSVTHLFSIDPSLLGKGPNVLQAVALYPDNEAVRSRPVAINVVRSDAPPVISAINRTIDTNGVVTLSAASADPEGDEISTTWLQGIALPAAGKDTSDYGRVRGGSMSDDGGAPCLKAETNVAVCMFSATGPLRELAATISVPPDSPPIKSQLGGLAFNCKDEKNFSFFGLWGDTSAWMLGRYENGEFHRIAAYGSYLEPNTWYRIAVRKGKAGGIEALVNDNVVARWPEGNLSGGDFGAMAGTSSARFKDIAVMPPMYPENAMRVQDDKLLVVNPKGAEGRDVIARCSDGSRSSETVVSLKDPETTR